MKYVDKLAKDKSGVTYLLVLQDLFDGTVDAKGMKTEDSWEAVRAFLTMTRKKEPSQKLGLTRGHNLLENLKN